MRPPLRRVLAALLACTVGLFPMARTVDAAMVATGESVAASQASGGEALRIQARAARGKLVAALQGPALAGQLESLGLSPQEAAQRVAALDDATAIDAEANLDRMPAGGGALGIAVFVVAVLFLTDAIGLTRVFPYIFKRDR